MGLTLDLDLDTIAGSSHEVYVRVENVNFNRVNGNVKVAVTYWINQEESKLFRSVRDRSPLGQIGNTVILYPEDLTDSPQNLELPTYFEFSSLEGYEEQVPQMQEVDEEVKVPYYTFDSEGNIEYKARVEVVRVEKQVGFVLETKYKIDPELDTNLLGWVYRKVKEKLQEVTNSKKILDN